MDSVNSVPNENDDTDGAKVIDGDTIIEDAENAAFKEDQFKVNKRAEITVKPIVSCV